MFADDYDPNDIPADQARGYSYPVPDNPLVLPIPLTEEDDDYDPSDVPQDQAAPAGYLPPTDQYDDYDPTDIPADQAAPASASYLPAGAQYEARRGRTLHRNPARTAVKMKHHVMKNAKRAKAPMAKRKPKALGSGGRRFSSRRQSEATMAAQRQGRQIMSVSEWLRRG